MRVSVRKGDLGYKHFDIALNCDVFVDGEAVTDRCHTADEEEGKAYCYLWNEKGKVFLDATKQEAAEEILTGKVEIKLRQSA